MRNISHSKPRMGEISQIALLAGVCDIAPMAKGDIEPGISAQLNTLLERVKPDDLTPRQWCLQSNVSTSFFTDLRKGTEPGIDKVERLANRAGITLTQLIEGRAELSAGRLAVPIALPSVERLRTMMAALLKTTGIEDPTGELADALAQLLPNALEQAGAVLAPPESARVRRRGAPPQRPATKGLD